MRGLQGFTILLLLQAAGELLARALHLPLPGPVIGMMLLLACLAWTPLRAPVQACAEFILSHLSLLFVPISVGVITLLPLLQTYGLRLAVVLLVSTVLGLAATGWALQWLLRRSAPQQSQHE